MPGRRSDNFSRTQRSSSDCIFVVDEVCVLLVNVDIDLLSLVVVSEASQLHTAVYLCGTLVIYLCGTLLCGCGVE